MDTKLRPGRILRLRALSVTSISQTNKIETEGRMGGSIYKYVLKNNLLRFAEDESGANPISKHGNDPEHTLRAL